MDTPPSKALKLCQQETVWLELYVLANGGLIARYPDGRYWGSTAHGEQLELGDYNVIAVRYELCVASTVVQ